jgi:aryl carrier-like protein
MLPGMYVGGAGVSRGYHGRPALTAERFVPDPFGEPGTRLYRTGDVAVRLPDGQLEFRGRADDQLQLHGFRIEPGEIERALCKHPGVRDAVCVLREDEPGWARLVCYVVPARGESVATDDLRAALLAELPEHMVPTAFVPLPSLPLTANGKLDRSALPAPDSVPSRGVAPVPVVAPSTSAERAVAAAWSAVLGAENPGVHDNFFAVGGDSIIAVRLAAAAREQGYPLSVERVFLSPTIAELAAAHEADPAPVDTAAGAATLSTGLADLDPELVPKGVVDAYPTAAMQLAILFECELTDDPALYHDLISVLVDGDFDHGALERALATVAERHEMLRTSFDLTGHREPVQLVHRTASIPLSVEDGAGAVTAADNPTVRRWWARERQDHLEVDTPPLVHCHVLRHEPGSFQLSLAVHHAAFDGWSLARLATELLLVYDAELTGRREVLPTMPQNRFRDYVAAEQAASADAAAQRFWAEQSGAIMTKPLSALPGKADTDGCAFHAAVPSDLDASLRRLAGELGVPLKSVYLAAHAWAMRALSETSGVVTGVQVNGRLEGSELLLGLFLNMAPLHLVVEDGTWTELIESAFAAERDSQPYRRYPLAKIQQLAGPGHPVFDVAFNFVDFHTFADLDGLVRIRALDWWTADRHSFPLMVEVARVPKSGRREVTVTASTESTLAGTGTRLGKLVMTALTAIAATPHDAYPKIRNERSIHSMWGPE